MVQRPLGSLLGDETGQDLIEYGLLTGIIGISAVLILPALINALSAVFTSGSGGLYNDAQANWFPKDPQ